jgi:Tol biopolymer transport system component
MTDDQFARRLPELMRQLAGDDDGYIEDVVGLTAGTSQRRAWTFISRWLPMVDIQGRAPTMRARFLPLVVLIAILAILELLAATAVFVGSHRQAPLPSPVVSNGWIAYSTDGQNTGSTDVTSGSDIYIVREGSEPKLIAGRQGGTTRNVCPAFSPDGTRLAFGVASNQGRAVVVLGLDANGAIGDTVHITVPGSGPGVCVRWSSDGTRVGYLDGGIVVVRGLDGSTPPSAAGDPGASDLERGRDPAEPLLSPAGDRIARIASQPGSSCQIVVSTPDGSAARAIALAVCGYAIAAWSPDGRQVLLLQEVGSADFAMQAIAVDSLTQVTIVSTVRTNGTRSEPGRGDVSWQPVFP